MAQQPNQELDPSDRPLDLLDTAPPRLDTPDRPGLIMAPDQKPHGAEYGTPGPDTGFALRILALADLPDEVGPRLRKVLAALMGARAAHFGRAPTTEDLEVALLLAGLGRHHSEDLDQRRARWVEAVSHERSPGGTAVADAGDLLAHDPEHADLLLHR